MNFLCEILKYHKWSQPQASSTSCTNVRVCRRCKIIEEVPVIHIWKEWEFASPGSCEMTRFCQKCGIEDVIRISSRHEWSDWSYFQLNSCEKERFCRRCGKKEVKSPFFEDHEWSISETGPFSHGQVCSRCGEQDNPRSDVTENVANNCKSCGCPGGPNEHSLTCGEVQSYL